MDEAITLQPIGVVRSTIASRKEMATLGVPAAVELFDRFAAGLKHWEKNSHVWVLAWLGEASREVLEVTPRGVAPGPAGLHGVFAVRSPARPNPIGLTAARVVSCSANRVELDRLDFIDGTPVLDLKPYYATRDLIYAARNAQVGRPADRDAIRESLRMQGENFCGAVTPEVERAAEILSHFRAEVLGFVDPPRWRITAPVEMADALMAMTRVRLGDESLRLHDAAEVIIEHGGRRYRY